MFQLVGPVLAILFTYLHRHMIVLTSTERYPELPNLHNEGDGAFQNDLKTGSGGDEPAKVQPEGTEDINDIKPKSGEDEPSKVQREETKDIVLFNPVYINEAKDQIIWGYPDGEISGVDFGVFNYSFLHAHIMVDEEDAEAGLFEFDPIRLEEKKRFEKEKIERRREFNRRLRRQELKNFLIFSLLLALMGWKLFALIFWKACLFYWVNHSPYPKRIQQVKYFLGEVGFLLKLFVMGSISFRESVKIFLVSFAHFRQKLKSRSYLNPQALGFVEVLGIFIKYWIYAVLKPFYIPIISAFGIGLWIDLRNHKFRIPIMIIYGILLSIILYSELEWHFKGRFKKVDRRVQRRRRPAFPYTNKKWK